MTPEQKAKAYDEAIAKGKQIQNTPYTAHWDIMKEVAEHLLPELKESDDERMIKSMTRLVKAFYDVNFPTPEGFTKEDMLAWLEKQGETSPVLSNSSNIGKVEQKPSWSEEDKRHLNSIIKRTVAYGDSSIYGLIKGDIDWLKSLKDRILPQPKQEWSEEDERTYRGLHNLIYSTPYCDSRKELSDFLDSLKNRLQSNLQQEWGKEDEKCIKLSTDIIDSALRAGFCVQLDRDRCVDWLESLKDRVHTQLKQELSEEDEECLNVVDSLIWYHLAGSETDKTYYSNWLKSIKPQSQWKPSEDI